LPSYYREGVPKSLIEAAAIGRPIITTDTVGCRDIVDDGVNGFFCKSRDHEDLAEKMERVVLLTAEKRAEMGEKSRVKAEREFDEQFVVEKYLDALDKVGKRS